MHRPKSTPASTFLHGVALLLAAVTPAGWRARRARKRRRERLQIEREVERRRRYYCRRSLRGLEAAVAGLEEEMAAVTAEELGALAGVEAP